MTAPVSITRACPFCGRSDLLQAFEETDTLTPYWVVDCLACGARGPTADTPEAAVAGWNGVRL